MSAGVSLPSPYGHTNLCTPIVSMEPVYRGRALKGMFSKPRSAAESESSVKVTLVDLNDISVKCCTPYRLPRIPPPCDTPTTLDGLEKMDGEERVFGRYGYEDVVRMPELGPSISKALINPHSSLAQTFRQSKLAVPRFKNAAITPSFRNTPFGDPDDNSVDEDYDHHSLFKRLSLRKRKRTRQSPVIDLAWPITEALSAPDVDTSGFRLQQSVHVDGTLLAGRLTLKALTVELTNLSGTPGSRMSSPSKSIKSIHWALGNEKNPVFDKTGRSHAQGPFSREFTVRCMPPPNWMRMKWGRSRTIVH